jgi:hypothetical protein
MEFDQLFPHWYKRRDGILRVTPLQPVIGVARYWPRNETYNRLRLLIHQSHSVLESLDEIPYCHLAIGMGHNLVIKNNSCYYAYQRRFLSANPRVLLAGSVVFDITCGQSCIYEGVEVMG